LIDIALGHVFPRGSAPRDKIVQIAALGQGAAQELCAKTNVTYAEQEPAVLDEDPKVMQFVLAMIGIAQQPVYENAACVAIPPPLLFSFAQHDGNGFPEQPVAAPAIEHDDPSPQAMTIAAERLALCLHDTRSKDRGFSLPRAIGRAGVKKGSILPKRLSRWWLWCRDQAAREIELAGWLLTLPVAVLDCLRAGDL
jgi:hypothetical protein